MKNLKGISTLFRPTIFLFATAVLLAGTPAWAAPPCPFESRFGKQDEIGASQTQTPEKALEAKNLIDTGQVFDLSHVLAEETVPLPFGRVYDNGMFTFVFAAPPANPTPQMFSQGPIVAFMGQLGTQIDALGHTGHPELGFYNCIQRSDVEPELNNSVDTVFPNGFALGLPTGFTCNPFDTAGSPPGCVPDAGNENVPGENDPGQGELQKLGVETIKPFFTRGVLIDLKNYLEGEDVNGLEKKKGKILPASFVVDLDHVLEVMEAEGVEAPNEGDVVIFYTGWDEKYGDEQGNNELITESPGIGIEVADWLAERKVAMAGADNLALEALDGNGNAVDQTFPGGHPLETIANGMPFPVHFRLITAEGIHVMELMKLEALADALADKFKKGDEDAYEFAFVYASLPLKGMGGSPGRPLVID